jgi:hypothetical protein
MLHGREKTWRQKKHLPSEVVILKRPQIESVFGANSNLTKVRREKKLCTDARRFETSDCYFRIVESAIGADIT